MTTINEKCFRVGDKAKWGSGQGGAILDVVDVRPSDGYLKFANYGQWYSPEYYVRVEMPTTVPLVPAFAPPLATRILAAANFGRPMTDAFRKAAEEWLADPPVVGDTVKIKAADGSVTYKLLAIDGNRVWMKHTKMANQRYENNLDNIVKVSS